MDFDFVRNRIEEIKKKDELRELVSILRPIAINHKSNQVYKLIKKALKTSIYLKNKKMTVFLYDLQIRQLYHLKDNLNQISVLLDNMNILASEIQDKDCIALVNQLIWHVEKFKGNKNRSQLAINKAIELVDNSQVNDSYTFYFIKYSFAIEKWLNNHSIESSILLEECLDYFYESGFHRSFTQSIAILGIIYTRMQKGNEILEKCRKILENKALFEKLPDDIKGISYYFTGLGYMIDLNLNFAESFFEEAYNILKPIYKESNYFSNFIVLHSYIITVKALQGKLEQSWKIVQEVENLLEQEFFEKNLDLGTKKQIHHTLNLNKFYVYSRLKNFDSDEIQDLVKEIFIGNKNLYSDFMLLNEFVLNSNLEPSKLEEFLSVDNFSINRVKHIISFVLQKDDKSNQQYLNRIKVLKNREKTTKTTFIENVFADLLIAQQLFSLKRYGEIYPLLMKYEKQLQRIEVLELRIFMEAFIHVGAFKSGDPLGPALQYMAIKKCRNYGFSRLENKLLDYLDMQHRDIQSLI